MLVRNKVAMFCLIRGNNLKIDGLRIFHPGPTFTATLLPANDVALIVGEGQLKVKSRNLFL